MTEKELEIEYLHYGTVKRKADLLEGLDVSPLKLHYAIKKFGQPIPQNFMDGEDYAADFFDFLLDFDESYYEKFPESLLRDRLTGYIYHEIWLEKLRLRHFENRECAVAMDMRKCLKDHASNIAQIGGRLLKNMADGLPLPAKTEFLRLFQESANEVAEIAFAAPLEQLKLLKPEAQPEPEPQLESDQP
jgi:hypothetical protein